MDELLITEQIFPARWSWGHFLLPCSQELSGRTTPILERTCNHRFSKRTF